MRKVSKAVRKVLVAVIVVSILLSSSLGVLACGDTASQKRLTGVNWFGFEGNTYCAHGLWVRDYKSMLKQIKDLGFNCVRIPWSNEMLDKAPVAIQINENTVDPYTGKQGLNTDLKDLTSIEVLDKIIIEAAKLGIYIVLDNHNRSSFGFSENLWYTKETPEEKWISDWVFMAKRYKRCQNVVGYDLDSDPHGTPASGAYASWGYNVAGYENTDWKAAAEKCGQAILEVSPKKLIFVEGVEHYNGKNYWWGGNLAGVKDYPITAIPKKNLVYSVHEYGPEVFMQQWFSDPEFPNNMYKIWDEMFWFIQKENIAPVFVGEFGIFEYSAADPSSAAYKWCKTFLDYVGSKASWTIWSINPNSGDTGGILKHDWLTVEDAKYNLIKPYLNTSKVKPMKCRINKAEYK